MRKKIEFKLYKKSNSKSMQKCNLCRDSANKLRDLLKYAKTAVI